MGALLHAAQWSADAAEPLWSSIPKAIGPAIAALVAVGLATAGYFKYLRGRIFKPRLALELTGTVVTLQRKPALQVQVAVRNEGQSGVVLDPCFTQSLAVFLADAPVWADATTDDERVVLWFDGLRPHRELDVLEDRGLQPFRVRPFRAEPAAAPSSADLSTPAGRHDGSRVERYVLEPGEQERRALLIPVAPACAYLLQLTVHACTHAGALARRRHRRCEAKETPPDRWQTRTIVCRADRPRRWWR